MGFRCISSITYAVCPERRLGPLPSSASIQVFRVPGVQRPQFLALWAAGTRLGAGAGRELWSSTRLQRCDALPYLTAGLQPAPGALSIAPRCHPGLLPGPWRPGAPVLAGALSHASQGSVLEACLLSPEQLDFHRGGPLQHRCCCLLALNSHRSSLVP